MDQSNLAENLEEIIIHVDENNNEIGYITRKEMREKHLFHRATFIFLINSEKKIFVHLRHKDKKWAGNHWTTVFGGCVAVIII